MRAFQNPIRFSPWVGRIAFPSGVNPLSFQIDAARFALSRDRSYLALDPGLGKTIVAALVLETLGRGHVGAVFIVPPFLVLNTRAELMKWAPNAAARVLVFPDSLLVDPLGDRNEMFEHARRIASLGGTLFIDEAHRFKTEETKRTKALFGDNGLAFAFSHVVLLSGTPMPNRPMELFVPLSRLAPETIEHRNRFRFGMKYCAGHVNRTPCKVCHGQKTVRGSRCHYCRGTGGFENGYDFTGASNMAELGKRVKEKFMLRLRTKDVLKDLPPLSEEMVIIGEDLPPKVARLDAKLLATLSPDDLMREKFGADTPLMTYRRLLGAVKVKPAAELIAGILETESVLVFAEHRATIARLEKTLAKFAPVVITGAVPKEKRHALVTEFQSNPKRRLFIGNIRACGVGFTLTKATRVVFVEFAYPPGDNTQAAKRAHRIGTKSRVHCQYLVFKNSIDRSVIESNLRKRANMRHI